MVFFIFTPYKPKTFMKKIALLLALITTIACKKEEKGYQISGSALGFEDGTKVYVNAVSQSNRPSIIDSATVKNEKFKIKLPKVEDRDFNYLTFSKMGGNVLFLAEDHPIKMTIYKDSLKSSKVEGGSENELFFSYLNTIKEINDRRIKLKTEIQYATKLNETEKVQQILDEQKSLQEKELSTRKDFALNHGSSLISVIALTDLARLKTLTPKEMQDAFAGIDTSLKTTRLGKNLQMMINNAVVEASRKKVDVGVEAEDFAAPTPEGKMLSLKEAMGKVTIIDFWASWCKPCRIENPNVVRVYDKYHDKGLNIIGVSLDKVKPSWLKAIKDDNLQWDHISNLQYWQEPIAKQYGVRSIPATFILDETGKVVAKNLRGPALENKIAELLGQQAL